MPAIRVHLNREALAKVYPPRERIALQQPNLEALVSMKAPPLGWPHPRRQSWGCGNPIRSLLDE